MTPFDTPGKQAISPFPTVFSTHLDNILPFSSNLKLSCAKSFNSEESKICHLVMDNFSYWQCSYSHLPVVADYNINALYITLPKLHTEKLNMCK